MESLLDTFEVSSQMLTIVPSINGESLEKMFYYDTDKVHLLIEKEVDKSLEFLKDALK